MRPRRNRPLEEWNRVFMFLMFGGTGLLLAGLGIPLWLRRIPPNHLYGFRSRATLSDEAIWYAANPRGLRHANALMRDREVG